MGDSLQVTFEAIKRRDPEAIAALVREHQSRLRGYVAVLSADVAAVDDLSQEVFLRALQRLDRVADLEGFDRYLHGIARNVVKEHSRKHSRSCDRYERLLEKTYPADVETSEDSEGMVHALRRCVEELPPRSRQILTLRYREERAADEIASRMAMNAGAVRVVLLRIRGALLKCIRSRVSLAVLRMQP